MRDVELMVIGAGPAGLTAARAARSHGHEVLLVDENPVGDEALARNVPHWYGARAASSSRVHSGRERWLTAHPIVEPGVVVMRPCAAWGVFAVPARPRCHVVGLLDGAHTSLVCAQAVVLATGGTDQYLAFPGWTIPGVLGGVGALQRLDLSGGLNARRMLVVGSGQLALEVVRRAQAAGITVVGVVEIGPEVAAGAAAATELAQRGVHVWTRHTLGEVRRQVDLESAIDTPAEARGEVGAGSAIETRGAGGVGSAIDVHAEARGEIGADSGIATLAEARGLVGVGSAIIVAVGLARGAPGAVTVEVDAVCVAIGREPSIELAAMAGCALDYDIARGGWFVQHDADGHTSQPGVFVAGDAGGCVDADFADSSPAESSGERAGLAAASWLRDPRTAVWPALERPIAAAAELGREAAADRPNAASQLGGERPDTESASLPRPDATVIADAAHFPSPWHAEADRRAADDLLVCHCETITRGELLEAIRRGGPAARDPNELKRLTRAGMGVCQGRGCRITIATLLASAPLGAGRTRRRLADIPPPTFRPPARPVPLAALATEDALQPVHLQAFADAEARLAHHARAGRLVPLALMRFRRAAEEAAFNADRDGLSAAEIEAIARALEAETRRTEARE